MAKQITFGGHSRAAILRGVNKLDRGYLSPYFVTNAETMGAELENPVILLSEKKISSMRDLLPILEEPRSQRKRNVEPAKLQLILGIDTSQLLNTLRLYATGNRLAGGRHAIETYSLDAMGQSEKLQSPNT